MLYIEVLSPDFSSEFVFKNFGGLRKSHGFLLLCF